jgi:hypothetical protein
MSKFRNDDDIDDNDDYGDDHDGDGTEEEKWVKRYRKRLLSASCHCIVNLHVTLAIFSFVMFRQFSGSVDSDELRICRVMSQSSINE